MINSHPDRLDSMNDWSNIDFFSRMNVLNLRHENLILKYKNKDPVSSEMDNFFFVLVLLY